MEKEKLFIKAIIGAIILTWLFFTSCKQTNIAEIEPGLPLPADVIQTSSEVTQLMTSPASFGNIIQVEHNKYKFEVELNDNKIVKFVSTVDPNFKTADNIKIGDTYQEIKNKLNEEWAEPGFAYCTKSKTNWVISFFDNYFLKTRQISDTSKVVFFFKKIN